MSNKIIIALCLIISQSSCHLKNYERTYSVFGEDDNGNKVGATFNFKPIYFSK